MIIIHLHFEVMEVLPTLAFKPPTNLEQYDGLTNLEEHLEGFRVTILLFNAPNAIMCYVFSTS